MRSLFVTKNLSLNFPPFSFFNKEYGGVPGKPSRGKSHFWQTGNYMRTMQTENNFYIATLFCQACRQYQCEKCSNVHKLLNYLSGHKIIWAEEVKSVQAVFDMKGLDRLRSMKNRLRCSMSTMISRVAVYMFWLVIESKPARAL